MKSFILSSILLLGVAGAAFAQDVANVDPAVTVGELKVVVDKCALVASTEKPDGNVNRGLCISTTQAYLDTLKATTPALSVDDFDQRITDLVLALVPLAQEDETCNAIDDEIAQAIKLASTYSLTEEQIAQLVQISETVAKCDSGATADIPEIITPSPAA